MPFTAEPIFDLSIDPNAWQRPVNWLPTDVTPDQQKVQLLVAVSTDTSSDINRTMAFTISGNHAVSWGDGTAPESVTAGVAAKHIFNPAGLPDLAPGWKQALVTITPQSGQTITSINLDTPYYSNKTTRGLVQEVIVGAGTLTNFTCGSSTGQSEVKHIAFLGNPLLTTMVVGGNPELRVLEGNVRWNTTNMSSIFTGNYKQTVFPTFTFVTLPTSCSSTFNACFSMTNPPVLDMTNVTSTGNMFTDCRALTDLPAWVNTSKSTSVSGMFQGCNRLESASLDVGAATTVQSLFSSCFSLRSVTLTNAFNPAATTALSMFLNCLQLETINGVMDASGITTTSSMFAGCGRLRHLSFAATKGPKVTWTLTGLEDAPTLNAVYDSLPVVTGQTLTVTGIPGTLTDDPTIATAKGWTVTGS